MGIFLWRLCENAAVKLASWSARNQMYLNRISYRMKWKEGTVMWMNSIQTNRAHYTRLKVLKTIPLTNRDRDKWQLCVNDSIRLYQWYNNILACFGGQREGFISSSSSSSSSSSPSFSSYYSFFFTWIHFFRYCLISSFHFVSTCFVFCWVFFF